MTKNEIEAKLREMREIRVRAFRDFKNPVLDGEEISWREFEEEQKKLRKMHLEIMKTEDGWYYATPVKDVLVANGKVVLGVCKKYNDFTDHHLMLVYKMIKKSWDEKRVVYSGREIQSDERGIYARVPDGATPEEIDEGKYQLREVYDTGSCHDLEEIYAELRGGNEAD